MTAKVMFTKVRIICSIHCDPYDKKLYIYIYEERLYSTQVGQFNVQELILCKL